MGYEEDPPYRTLRAIIENFKEPFIHKMLMEIKEQVKRNIMLNVVREKVKKMKSLHLLVKSMKSTIIKSCTRSIIYK